MGTLVEIKIPDIGDFEDVEVIEVMVKPGDRVGVDDPLVTIESDKASMEVPAPQAGVVKELKVKLGDKVSEGSSIVVLETEALRIGGRAVARAAADAAVAGTRRRPHRPARRLRDAAGVIAVAAGDGDGDSPRPSRTRAPPCASSRESSASI